MPIRRHDVARLIAINILNDYRKTQSSGRGSYGEAHKEARTVSDKIKLHKKTAHSHGNMIIYGAEWRVRGIL